MEMIFVLVAITITKWESSAPSDTKITQGPTKV